MIERRQFIKQVAAGAVVLAMPYLWLPRKSAIAQVAPNVAFIGAQGFGAGANGWRASNARILFVTNLNNSGAGSLRAAAAVTGPKYIIFRTAGYIDNASDLPTNSNTYLAGQSAPGDGICVRHATAGWKMETAGSHICIRHLAIRSQAPVGTGAQGMGLFSTNTIMDHCSTTWADDDNLFFNGPNCDLLTVQYCLSGEALNGKALLRNGGGTGTASLHHNFLVHAGIRFPELYSGDTEVINNLCYNFGAHCQNFHNGFGDSPRINVIKTFVKWGPSTAGTFATGSEILTRNYTGLGSLYISGCRCQNITGSSPIDQRVNAIDGGLPIVGSPHSFSPVVAVTQHNADTLATTILSTVGASRPVRSAIDQAIVDSFNAGTGSQTITSITQSLYALANGGNPWPTMSPGTADHLDPSGMTDEFITRMGLANTVASALSTSISTARGQGESYQNIEWSLMEKAGDIPPLQRSGSAPSPARLLPPGNLRQ